MLNPNPMMFRELSELQLEVIMHPTRLVEGGELLDICLIDLFRNYSHVVTKTLD